MLYKVKFLNLHELHILVFRIQSKLCLGIDLDFLQENYTYYVGHDVAFILKSSLHTPKHMCRVYLSVLVTTLLLCGSSNKF